MMYAALRSLATLAVAAGTASIPIDASSSTLLAPPDRQPRNVRYEPVRQRPNRYAPHQGEREKARRRRQMDGGQLTGIGVIPPLSALRF